MPRRLGQSSRLSVFIKVCILYSSTIMFLCLARDKRIRIAIWLYIDQPLTVQSTMDQHTPISTQPLPVIQSAPNPPLPQNSQHVLCATCPSIWCFHLESIMFSDTGDKGISNLKRSYQDLRQHVHEAHQWHYGAGCALCENLFCYHLGKMMLLEAKMGDFTGVKIDLRSSFMTLREHIQEAHGGC